jgi:DNA-directed RNA polymerase specialized sigma24 family protein
MAKQEPGVYRAFPVTQWSLVARAGDVDVATKRQALAELLGLYLPAIKSYLTLSKRIDPDRADDLVQSFLTGKVLEQDLIEHADQERGKFRTFLLTALDRFIVNQHRYERAQKRSPSQMGSIDDQPEPAQDASAPDETFDIAWAKQVLERTIERMRIECKGSGRTDIWQVFEARVLAPTLGQTEAMPYEELIQQAGFASPVQAANALVTAKRMFARTLRTVIGEYEGGDAEIDGEIDDLHAILARA